MTKMAESTEEACSSSTNWWGSFLSTAKSKGSQVLEFVKKDLEELGTAVKNEASSIANSTSAALEKTLKLNEPDSTASTVKRSISSFLDQVNTALNPLPDDSDTEAILLMGNSTTFPLTKTRRAIYDLQMNDSTYLDEIDPKDVERFSSRLHIIECALLTEDKIADELASNTALRDQYIKLVPEKVGHHLFWKNYFFRKFLLKFKLGDDFDEGNSEVKTTEPVERMERRIPTEEEIDEILRQMKESGPVGRTLLSEQKQEEILEQYENEIKMQQWLEVLEESDNEQTREEVSGNAKKKQRNRKAAKKGNAKPSTGKKEASTTDSSVSLEGKKSTSSSDGDWEKVRAEKISSVVPSN